MQATESLQMENDRRGYHDVCSDCEAYGLKKHGLPSSDRLHIGGYNSVLSNRTTLFVNFSNSFYSTSIGLQVWFGLGV